MRPVRLRFESRQSAGDVDLGPAGRFIIVGVVLGNAGERAAELAAVRRRVPAVGQMTLVVATLLLFAAGPFVLWPFDPNAGGRNQMSSS